MMTNAVFCSKIYKTRFCRNLIPYIIEISFIEVTYLMCDFDIFYMTKMNKFFFIVVGDVIVEKVDGCCCVDIMMSIAKNEYTYFI